MFDSKVNASTLSGKQGVDVSRLEVGTRLKVETHNSTYHIEILEYGKATVSGGLKSNGDLRFPNSEGCSIVGCCNYKGTLRLDWLGKNKCLLLDMDEGKNLQTSPMCELTVTAPDDSWTYCFDWRISTD